MKTLKHTKIAMMVMAAIMVLGFSSGVMAEAGAPTAKGVQPVEYPGNFVSETDDNQVCYDMSALGYIGEITEDMKGFKIDPPVSFTTADGAVETYLSADGKYLDWTIENGGKMLAFIVKGGPNYNVYNYVPFDYLDDQKLHSPLFKNKLPQISHYNVCYIPDTGGNEFQGCTPGYWRNHADRWLGVLPSADFDYTFGVDLFTPDITLAMAITKPQTYGAFAFHATAALLNSYGGVPNSDDTTVNYPYSTQQVIDMVKAAVAVLDDPDTEIDESKTAIEDAKDIFATANELGCPLSGTKADPLK
ncbi:MAG: hypothetical protein KGZ88_13295 [Methylomicrobium sp.]|nr:hypothetical protein [Methylomicrobium sp.]